MPTHVPKRVYTASALEGWFDHLSKDWEGYFIDHEIALGRQIYQDGLITSIELQSRNAIVHGRLGGKDTYALIEWESEPPTVRLSTQERLQGRALAVAGLYEIEEMVADSVSPLPPEAPEEAQAAPKSRFSKGLFADDKKPVGFANAPSGNFSPSGSFAEGVKHIPERNSAAIFPQTTGRVASRPVVVSRGLVVKFSVVPEGVAFDAYWRKPDIPGNSGSNIGEFGSQSMEPALKLCKSASAQLTEGERESLIRLTALARKNGFELGGKKHDYALSDFQKIPELVKNGLATWKKYFELELGPEVLLLVHGARTITVEVEARTGGEALQFHWLFLLGGRELTKEQIRVLLKAPREVVLIPELGLVKLSDEQSDVICDWQEAILSGDGTLPKYMLFSIFRQDALPIRLSKELEGWTRALLDEPDDSTGSMPAILRDYQKRGVAWLRHMISHDCHPLLADEMGLGKTLQMLSLIGGAPAGKTGEKLPNIVVAPASVVPVWAVEAQKYFPELKVQILTHDNFPKAEGQSSTGELWLASYGQLKRQEKAMESVKFHYAVLDEAQMIKNPRTKTARACYALSARHRLAMTGTPVENRPLDLWSIFRFLMPGLLGGSARFEQMTAELSGKLMEKLRQQVSPFILRRTKAEVAKELPEKIEAVLLAPMGQTQREHYARLVDQGLKRFGNDLRHASRQRGLGFFTLLTRLRQVSCDAGLLPWVQCNPSESGKINVMLERLEGIIAAGSKVVIFSQFVGFLNRIEDSIKVRFANVPRYELTGATIDRQKPVAAFQSEKGAAIMLVSLRAGGTGITLHAADYLFLMDPWWNPAVEDQAIDRVHRIGQKRTVFVYRVVSEGTVEARIQTLKASKKELFNNIVGTIRDNTHFALYFKSMSELIALAPKEDDENGSDENGNAVG